MRLGNWSIFWAKGKNSKVEKITDEREWSEGEEPFIGKQIFIASLLGTFSPFAGRQLQRTTLVSSQGAYAWHK